MDEVVISPTGLGFNAGYWSLVLGWAGWYLVRWKTDVPLGVWGKAAGLSDEVVKLLNEQEARGRRKAKALEEQVAPDRNAMSPVASSEEAGPLEGGYSSRERYFFKALGLFKLDNPFRRGVLRIVHSKSFDNFVLLLIALNAGLMALEDPLEDPESPSEQTVLLEQLDVVFLLVFTLEMALKLVAFGLVIGQNTYLRTSWNVLDAVIVSTAWMPYFLPVTGKTSGIRAFRLLRPLRTISRFPGLKRLVTAILLAVPQLGNLVLLVLLFFFTLGVVGVQLWSGTWLMRCHEVEPHPSCEHSIEGEECQLFLQYANDASAHCSTADPEVSVWWTNRPSCGAGDVCELRPEGSNPYYDLLSFDSLLETFPIVMQLLTLAAWQDLLHISMETSGLYCLLYYLSAVLIGAYFIMKLFVAVIKDKFDVAAAVADEGIDAFKGIDESGDGLLDQEEVGKIFLKNGVYLTEEELTHVFGKIDADGGGDVDVDEFMDWLRGPSSLAAKLRNKMSVDGEENDSDDDDSLDVDDPIASAKRKLTKLASMHDVVDWTILFNYYDRGGSGELEFLEFKAALRRDAYITPAQMSDDKILELFNHVDDDGGGTVSICEFEAWMNDKSGGGGGQEAEAEEEDEEAEAEAAAELDHAAQVVMSHVIRVVSGIMRIDDHSTIERAVERYAATFNAFVSGTSERKLVVYNQPKVVQAPNGEMLAEGKPHVVILSERMKQSRTLFDDDSSRLDGGQRVVVHKGRGDALELTGQYGTVCERDYKPSSDEGNRYMVRFENGVSKDVKRKYLRRVIVEECLVGNAVEFSSNVKIDGVDLSQDDQAVISHEELVKLGAARKLVREKLLPSPWFNGFFVLWILANVTILALDGYPTPSYSATLELANHVCTFVFLAELVIKQLGWTGREFWTDPFTLFDVFVVVTGVLEFAGWYGEQMRVLKIFRMFRLFRALRLLRVISFLEPLRTVLTVMVATLSDLIYIFLLTFLFVFIFTILGMQMFGGLYSEEAYIPRWNFDTFPVAMFTTFQVMTFDSWNAVMVDTVNVWRTESWKGWAMGFFVAWIIAGALTLMNLLLVIILESYVKEEAELLEAQEKQEKQEAALKVREGKKAEREENERTMMNPLAEEPSPSQVFDVEDDASEGSAQTAVAMEVEMDPRAEQRYTRSLGVFGLDNPLRRACVNIVMWKGFDSIILFVISLNCVTMGMQKPSLDPAGSTATLLAVTDVIFTVIFTVEAGMKSVAFGFAHGREAYLTANVWNQLDFSIVVISWVDYLAQAADIGFLKSLRLLRAFRALRLFNRIKSLQMLASSLVQSMLSLSNVIGVTVLVWIVFALTFMTYLKGRFGRCTDHDTFGILECAGSFVEDGSIAEASWFTPPVNFDNLGTSMYTLFEISSMNDWVVKAHYAMDATEVERSPIRDNSTWWGFAFMLFVVVNNFFLLNLFVGVIYEKYLAIRMAGLEKLTKQQRQWLSIMRHLEHVRPEKTHVASRADREAAFKLATSPRFEAFIMGTIVFNCGVMAVKSHGESEEMALLQTAMNEICTFIFTGEVGLKIWAFGFKGYFSETWNQFDFVVVVGSWVDILFRAMQWMTGVNSALFRIVRIARIVGRVARIFKASQQLSGLQIIFDTFINAMPQLFSIMTLILLILYIFAILGMNLFGTVVRHGPCLNEYRNFETAPVAMMTLFGVATGDGFACVAHACMVEENTYRPAICTDGTDCGNSAVAVAFFVAFSLIIMFSTIEMTVNIVMSKFDDLTQLAGLPITNDDCSNFVTCWQRFDNEATGLMPVKELPELFALMETGDPEHKLPPVRALAREELAGEGPIDPRELRLPESPDGKFSRFLVDSTQAPSFATALDEMWQQVDDDATVGFLELLYALCERKCGKPMPPSNQVVAEVRTTLGLNMPTLEAEVQKYVEAQDAFRKSLFLAGEDPRPGEAAPAPAPAPAGAASADGESVTENPSYADSAQGSEGRASDGTGLSPRRSHPFTEDVDDAQPYVREA